MLFLAKNVNIIKSDLKHLKLTVLRHMRCQNEKKKNRNATWVLAITYTLVIAVVGGEKKCR